MRRPTHVRATSLSPPLVVLGKLPVDLYRLRGWLWSIADLLFNKVNVDGYFLEWDNDRSGGFEPLRFLPKGKTVVLGLVTSKIAALEDKDTLKRRIAEAAKYAPLGPALPLAAMRLRLHRGRQCAGGRRAMGEAPAGARGR